MIIIYYYQSSCTNFNRRKIRSRPEIRSIYIMLYICNFNGEKLQNLDIHCVLRVGIKSVLFTCEIDVLISFNVIRTFERYRFLLKI